MYFFVDIVDFEHLIDDSMQHHLQVVDVDLAGDRRLQLRHDIVNGVSLEEEDAWRVLRHLANLWGYPVVLEERENDEVRKTYETQPSASFE